MKLFGTLLNFINNVFTTEGDLVIRGGTIPERLAAVASGQVLLSAGVGAKPTWGSGPLVKGWVQFKGTGTVTIQDSFNVSSITDNSVGNFTVNWDTNFATDDYCFLGTCEDEGTSPRVLDIDASGNLAVGSATIEVSALDSSNVDVSIICCLAIG